MNGTLTELNVYPLKSGGGTPLRSAELTARGLPYDREFMLVTPEGRFLSQRDFARMALMRPSYDGEILTVNAPGALPLTHKAVDDGEIRDVTVARKECRGVDQGDEAAAWFSSLFDYDCRLVRFTGHRPTSVGDGEVMFADGYPLLVISAESLADLNTRLDEPLPMNRFRPSLVIEGLGPFAEDDVRLLRVGETVIEMVKPCNRCVITTTDQKTAERGREPLRTLATYRTWDRGIMFGQNCVPRALGTLAVGDPVEILDPHPSG
ncbi:MOSC domain-containing protein [Actinomadura darangshiensis]|uniref:MOSC domain-containing protein n=1 Tax=Actinomadura darangshiensis TaxID=705336 RepID=A0A4R5ASK3_9ACTN|nr:MOSC N-terminal beta barrel domain-containing protein [Actinomadura darangshiensis]TDD76188.1 MOSC domain-containing protein [Actinomadura darangshiensis]